MNDLPTLLIDLIDDKDSLFEMGLMIRTYYNTRIHSLNISADAELLRRN
jgi:hypothetical protein